MNIERSQIKSQVKSIIAAKFAIDTSEIQDKDRLVKDLGLDSLDLLVVVEELEETFDLEIPDEALPGDLTLEKMIEDLYQAINGQHQILNEVDK